MHEIISSLEKHQPSRCSGFSLALHPLSLVFSSITYTSAFALSHPFYRSHCLSHVLTAAGYLAQSSLIVWSHEDSASNTQSATYDTCGRHHCVRCLSGNLPSPFRQFESCGGYVASRLEMERLLAAPTTANFRRGFPSER